MNEKKHGIGHNIRQAVLVTVVLLVLCGLVFPVLLSGLSAVIFPSQAKGSLVTADGIAVGAKNVGQDFTEDYFMWCRPSAYNYNTYYEEDTDGDGQVEQYYNDGSEFAGLSSGSNNYAPSNPALTERVEADIEEFLEKNPGVSREDIPTDLMTASAHILHTAGYTGAQLAMPRAIEGFEDFASATDAQLSAIFQAFDAEDIEITVLSCYMDLSAPDEPARLAGVENVKRCLRYAKQVGARMVGSETSWTALSDEEKALRRPLMLDSLQRIAEEAVRLNAVFGVEPVAIHPLCSPEILAELLQAVDAPNNIKVIFDPVNLFTTKDAQNAAFQADHWKSWLAVIGKQLGAMHCKDCRIEPDGTKTLVGLGKGQMNYAPILDWLAQYAPETPLIRDEVILECAPADIKILHQMQQSIEEKRMK